MVNPTQITYRYERYRALASGVLDTAGTTFLLAVAVRSFQAGALAKAIIATGSSLGLVLGPLLVSRVRQTGMRASAAAAQVMLLGAVCFLIVACVPSGTVYVAGSSLAMACTSVVIPLLTQVYQENYPEQTRGQLFARTMVIRIVSAAVFGHLAGRLLTARAEWYPALLGAYAAAMAASAFCAAHIPSRPLAGGPAAHPLHALRFAKEDALFRRTLIGWMFLGLGNLMMIPLRVEYLANPKYGVRITGEVLSMGAVALFTTVIPNIARVIVNPVWGWLFDRANFFVLRVALNIGFMLGILAFFMSSNVTGLVLGAVLYGVAIAGGDVAWSLWVTKFAPPDRVADYMSVHTFFTGLRGMVAPVLAFQLLSVLSLQAVSGLAAGLIMIGTVVFFAEVGAGKHARRAPALVEEISE